MPWKKLSPAQERLMEILDKGPLQIDAKVVGSGWRMRLGIEMRTIIALEKMGVIQRHVFGTGITRKMIVRKTETA